MTTATHSIAGVASARPTWAKVLPPLAGIALVLFQAPLVDMPADHARALVEPEAYLSYDDAAWVMFAAAGLGAALMAIPASLAAIRAGVPTWLGWLGVLAGVLSAGTIVFFGMFAWMAWILVASIVLLVARDT